MLTIFSTARAFTGHYAVIQRNAIISWTKLEPRPQIILFGNDEGTGAICDEFGLEHVPDVKLSDLGTPLISDMFEQAQRRARYDTCCLVNSDIILFDSVMETVRRVAARFDQYFVVGQRWDLDIMRPLSFDVDWQESLHKEIERSAHRHAATGIDYFLFNTGRFEDLPAFAIGRTSYDTWMIWHAGDLGTPVIDATRFLDIVHQNHDYSHGGGAKAVWEGPEAQQARELVGHWSRYHSITHARYLLTADGDVQRATSLRYRLARPRRAVAHALRFTQPIRRRARDARNRLRTFRKQGADWQAPPAASSVFVRLATRWSHPAAIERVPDYRFGQILARKAARRRFACWALGRFFRFDEPVIMSWNGIQVASYLGNDLSRCMYVGGGYEPNEMTFLLNVLRPGQVMIDVGANEGIYSLQAAGAVGAGGTVVAVEPSPREARRLRKNLRLNNFDHVTVVDTVLLDAPRPAILQIADNHHPGQNTLGEFVYEGVAATGQVTMNATTLDDLVRDLGITDVRLIKIDVEGAETMVLRGGHDVLRKFRPLMLIEMQDASLRHQGSSVGELLDELATFDYEVFNFSDRSGRPAVKTRSESHSPNVVACPSELVSELVDAGVLEQ